MHDSTVFFYLMRMIPYGCGLYNASCSLTIMVLEAAAIHHNRWYWDENVFWLAIHKTNEDIPIEIIELLCLLTL